VQRKRVRVSRSIKTDTNGHRSIRIVPSQRNAEGSTVKGKFHGTMIDEDPNNRLQSRHGRKFRTTEGMGRLITGEGHEKIRYLDNTRKRSKNELGENAKRTKQDQL